MFYIGLKGLLRARIVIKLYQIDIFEKVLYLLAVKSSLRLLKTFLQKLSKIAFAIFVYNLYQSLIKVILKLILKCF